MTARILLITAGGTPQVVTETVHWLLTRPEPWIPDRILIATTSQGADLYVSGDAAKGLPPLLGEQGRLSALFAHLGVPDRSVVPETLIPRLPRGALISDLRCEEEIEAFAELLLNTIGDITADPETELHVSLAGGRKTMSFIVGQVMSLYGRAPDILSHILVEPARIESLPSFWWPGQREAVADGKGKAVDISSARVELHTVPFVRLRAWLDANDIFDHAPHGYAMAVKRANAALAIDRLVIDLMAGTVGVGAETIDPPPSWLAPLALVALAAKQGRKLTLKLDDQKFKKLALDGDIEAGLATWAWLRAAADLPRVYGGNASLARQSFWPFEEKTDALIQTFHEGDQFRVPLSHVRGQVNKHFVRRRAEEILTPGRGRYSTHFPADKIDIYIPPELADHPNRPAGTSVKD
jgi:CRISPR-associated protein (TIGR02584 family)